jgi:signal transduction histidine kinase
VKRRIVIAIVLVAGLAVVTFGVPLGVVIDREFEGQALLRLERSAILATRDIPDGWQPGDTLAIDVPDRDTVFGVYDAAGTRVFGNGPARGDESVRTALGDRIGEAELPGSYVIAVPITNGGPVVAVLRAEQRIAVTDRRIRAAWASMGLLAFAVIGGSLLLARRLARRIAVPVEALRTNAARLGAEGTSPVLPRSGLAEIDDVAAALEGAATRVAESVERERAFSAEVSHQLRTPITGLRLLIETELVAPRGDTTAVWRDAAAAVARLESTIEDLLSLARNRPSDRGPLDLRALLQDLEQAWLAAFARVGRALRVMEDPAALEVTVVASRSALGHILDVLVDNARRHGSGTVGISCERVDGGIALRVVDDGDLGPVDPEELFRRTARPGRAATGDVADSERRGIGLNLARRLAQAEGGDLVCTSTSPTTFSVLFAAV